MSAEESEDYYRIRLAFRPAGNFRAAGVELFTIDKTGPIEFRQIISQPRLARVIVAGVAIAIVLVATGATIGALFASGALTTSDAPTPLTTSVSITPDAPARLVSPDGDVTVSLDANTVGAPSHLTYVPLSDTEIPALPTVFTTTGKAFELTTDSTLLNPITVTVALSAADALVSGGDENNILIQRISDGAWEALATTVDFELSTAKAQVDHLSVFALTIRVVIPTPTEIPTLVAVPTPIPTPTPIPFPTPLPTPTPFVFPTLVPTPTPIVFPTPVPTPTPFIFPTTAPTPTALVLPTIVPTATMAPPTPTARPTLTPTPQPSPTPNAPFYVDRGIDLYQSGEFQDAITQLGIAIQLGPSSLAYSWRGLAYHALGRYESAVQDYNEANALDPGDKDLHYNRGNAYYDLGDYDSAIDNYSEAIRLDGEFAEAYFRRGTGYDQLGDFNSASLDYSAAIAINREYRDAYLNRGNIYLSREEWANASIDFTAVIRYAPGDARGYNNRAIARDALALGFTGREYTPLSSAGTQQAAREDRQMACQLDSQYCLCLEDSRNCLVMRAL